MKRYQAFCLECCGGGKHLGAMGTKRAANIEATSHTNLYKHNVTILLANVKPDETQGE